MFSPRTFAAHIISAVEDRLVVATLHGIVTEENGVPRLRLRVRLESATVAGLLERAQGRGGSGFDSMVRELRPIPLPLHPVILRLADMNRRRDGNLHDIELRATCETFVGPHQGEGGLRLYSVASLSPCLEPSQGELTDLAQHFMDEFRVVCCGAPAWVALKGANGSVPPDGDPDQGTPRSHSRSVR